MSMKHKSSFFEEHMEYVKANDLVGMVNNTYTDDCVFYHNFPFFDGKPLYRHRGKEEIIKAEQVIFAPENQGKIEAGEPFNFIETEDFITFQIIVTSPNTGKCLVTDFWRMRDGKISEYYAFGYWLDGPGTRFNQAG